MEKVQEQTQDILDTFKADTKRYLEMFCTEYEIENLRTAPQNTFESALSYAGDNIFLKPPDKTFKYNRQTILDCDNASIIDYILDYYIFICGVYNKESNIQGFSKYIKVSEQTMYNWLNGEYKTKIYLDKQGNRIEDIQEWKLNNRGEYTEILSTAHLDIIKKLRLNDEHSLANIGISDRNNTGVAMKLNSKFGWNAINGREPEETSKRALSAAELPKLGSELSDNSEHLGLSDSG